MCTELHSCCSGAAIEYSVCVRESARRIFMGCTVNILNILSRAFNAAARSSLQSAQRPRPFLVSARSRGRGSDSWHEGCFFNLFLLSCQEVVSRAFVRVFWF
jgi:hypothetical protein